MGEILMILLVALLVYGGRLPEVAAAVGRSLGELKRGLRDTTDLVRDDLDQLADLDPRRAVRRAWNAPRVIGDDRAGPHPGDVASLPAPPTTVDTEPVNPVNKDDANSSAATASEMDDPEALATEDISIKPPGAST